MRKRLFNVKVRIETLEKKLSAENLWVHEYSLWKEVWAAVSLKDISSTRALYLFTVRWSRDFPKEFRVVIKDKIFKPTQRPMMEPSQDLVLFHVTEINN
ncbi:MAG: hypothetical protein LBG20_00035 [Holosporaceae bacterium]|jgi:hypothetical protein|nr:hypothetical protein [Holosporaceae bacterium]